MAYLSKPLRIMKCIVILLLALIPAMAGAQDLVINDESKTVTWIKIYESDITQNDVYGQILAYGILEDVVTYENMIAGDIPLTRLDYESLGYRRMSIPMYLSNDDFTARVILRFKEGRYMAEVVNMTFIGDMGASTLYSFTSSNFKDTPHIIISFLEKLTTFHKTESEW